MFNKDSKETIVTVTWKKNNFSIGAKGNGNNIETNGLYRVKFEILFQYKIYGPQTY